ncbi:MAG: glycosyl transferase [Flavobacteriales bacterium]|nr:glycosyl transferase [Flavobacteriales bacterium]
MKIVHITSAHSRYSTRIYHKMALSSVKAGHDVCIVVADGKQNQQTSGVSFYDVGQFKNKFLRILVSSFKAVLMAKSLKADIYHLHDPDLLFWALLLRSAGGKIFFDSHEDYPVQILHKHYLPKLLRKPLSIIFNYMQFFICKELNGVVTATPFIRKKFEKYIDKTIDIKNYPLKSEFDVSKETEKNLENKSFNITYIGGITSVRGIKEVVSSFELLGEQFSLKLAGRFLESDLKNNLESMPGWDNVEYMGFLSRSEVVDLLSKSDCGIVTLHPIENYIDALPIKMFEYMAMGLPVIASDFPLLRTILERYDCGLLVDPLDPIAISEAINYLHNNPTRAEEMGSNGKSAFYSNLNFDNEAIALNDFYEN